jgi:hypothetical protein
MWVSIGGACRAHLSMLSDPTEAALVEIEGAMNTWSVSATMAVPWFLTILAQAHGRLGRREQGLACIDDALSIVKQSRERLHLPFALQTKAELLLAGSTPDSSAAESILKESMQISREMNAQLPLLRAATRLARLWVEQGKAQEALKLLADCLGWFTEEFDAPDLQTAQALVDELKQPADADVG